VAVLVAQSIQVPVDMTRDQGPSRIVKTSGGPSVSEGFMRTQTF